MKFIELTSKNGEDTFLVNPSLIVGVDRNSDEDRTVIHMPNGAFMTPDTVQQIKEKLNEI